MPLGRQAADPLRRGWRGRSRALALARGATAKPMRLLQTLPFPKLVQTQGDDSTGLRFADGGTTPFSRRYTAI
jgi:hypothetical protein